MDWEVGQGTVNCTVCNVSYSTKIGKLSEEIDVYSEWIDQCEEVNAWCLGRETVLKLSETHIGTFLEALL